MASLEAYELIRDLKQIEWEHFVNREGLPWSAQRIFGGKEKPAEAHRDRFAPGITASPHYHLAAQFQLCLSGTLQFSDHRMEGLAVHYTDHGVAYGPFTIVGEGHDMFVLHARPAGRQGLDDKAAFAQLNKNGRELTGSEREARFEPVPNYPGTQCQTLFADGGVAARILDCAPGSEIKLEAASYGRYELVLMGSAVLAGRVLDREVMRYVQSDQPDGPFVAGPGGFRMIALDFDRDALTTGGGSFAQDYHLND